MRSQRRICIALTGALAIGLPAVAVAQQYTPRVGLLAWWDCAVPYDKTEFGPFVNGLHELGYTQADLTFECRSAGRNDKGLAAAAEELVQMPVDIIVTTSQPAGHVAHQITKTIPIVTIVSGDPVADGLAQSISKPGGNVTGVSYYNTELVAKRLELLMEAIPELSKVGVLANPIVSYLPFEADIRRASEELGVSLSVQQVNVPEDIDAAFSRMKGDGAQAVFVLPDLMLADQSARIAALAIENRLPSMAWGFWFTQDGCLMAYSADYSGLTKRLAFYVDRVLKGAKPGDLPFEQPAKFEFLINLKTAKALGIELPETVLLMADKVIE